jgi:heme A synthase
VLAYNVAVILWGAYVRASGSGAGCGNHWPLCNGEVMPQSPTAHTIIEFTHRAMTGIDTPLILLLLIWAFRAFPARHPVRLGATLSTVFLVTEALIGAALVKFEHVAQNASVARAWSLSAHLINTLTLLACLTLTAWWGATGKPRFRYVGRSAWMAGASVVLYTLLGISGVIAALGDTLFPVKTFAAGLAQDMDPAANIFLRLRLWHPAIAAVAGGWLLFYCVTSAGRGREARRLAGILGLAVAAQIVAGAANLLLAAPIAMQMLHLLLADAVWISLVLVAAATLPHSDS